MANGVVTSNLSLQMLVEESMTARVLVGRVIGFQSVYRQQERQELVGNYSAVTLEIETACRRC